MNKVLSVLAISFLLSLVAGCGVSPKKIENVKQRIKTLEGNGIPDSLISRAKVFIYQAENEKKRGNMKLVKTSYDSAVIILEAAEENFDSNNDKLKSFVDEKVAFVKEETKKLDSFHKEPLDSVLSIIDSLAKINSFYNAEAKTKELVNLLAQMKKEKEQADKLRPKVVGKWTFTDVITHKEDKTVHAVEKKIFTFNRNGNGMFVESKSGKSTPYFKEDWKFISYGKWGMRGDTVFLKVSRFKIPKQNFWDYKKVDGSNKRQWVKNPAPTYDSTITDGSQDRFIVMNDLKEDFVHTK